MIKKKKIYIINFIKKKIENVNTVIILNIKGIKTETFRVLRRILHTEKISINIIKNNLFKKAIETTKFASLKEYVKNQTAIIFDNHVQNVSIFKVLKKYQITHPSLTITGAVFNKEKINKNYINFLEKLPDINILQKHMFFIILNNIKKILYTIKHYLYLLLNMINYMKRKK